MENTGYPCRGCGAPADLVAGCRGCGRPPYPPAAEVVRLDREITELVPRVEAARLAYQDLSVRLVTARQRRAALAARVRQEIPAPRAAGPAPLPAPPPRRIPQAPSRYAPAARETSTRAVQGLLFVLGGLLLGTAAVVFTAVAWSTFGVAGRALILLAVTALALVAPLVARARGLRGTAETLASVALLLVVLDGSAAWSVDLFGVTGLPGSRYAALVAAGSAAVAAGYALVSRLTAPWFAAWLLAQPVLPLAAAASRPTAAGWALVLTAVALGDLAVVVVLRRRTSGSRTALAAGRVLGWTGHGTALVLAAGCALVPLTVGHAAGIPLLAGGPLLVVALALVAGALAAGGRLWRASTTGLLVPVLARADPAGRRVAARAAADRRRPGGGGARRCGPGVAGAGPDRSARGRARRGRRAGSGGGRAHRPGRRVHRERRLPGLAGRAGRAGPVLGLAASGGVAADRRGGRTADARAVRPLTGVAAAGLVALAAPAVTATPWPMVLVVDLATAAVLLLAAVARPRGDGSSCRSPRRPGRYCSGTRCSSAAPPGRGRRSARRDRGARRGARRAGPARAGRAAGGGRHGAGGGAARRTGGGGGRAARPRCAALVATAGALAAVVVPVVVVLAVRRLWTDLSGYASTGLAVALAGTGLVPLVAPGGEPVAPYATAGCCWRSPPGPAPGRWSRCARSAARWPSWRCWPCPRWC
ncbi:hypothetical protein V2I01_07155 [Micromonospora sp. BRA006-A]|nr:hypothetical protein [Micromonospora sp. BRA006-A]